MTNLRMAVWMFRALAILFIVWLNYYLLGHMDWLVLGASICFYVLGTLTHDRIREWTRRR